jgi:hypothetical protein
MTAVKVCLLMLLPLALCLGACGEKAKKAKAPHAKSATPKATTPPPAPVCKPACEGLACGDDSCGGSCGTCGADLQCRAGKCLPPPCTPVCAGKDCGPDGCGSTCGACPTQTQCRDSHCEPTVAVTFDFGRPANPADGLPAALHLESLGFPSDWSAAGTCTYGTFPQEPALQALAANPYSRLLLQLSPSCGLADFLVDGGAPALRTAAAALAAAIKAHPVPVFLAFGPGMNAPWTPYSVCNEENSSTPNACLASPEDFAKAFLTLQTLLAPAAPNLTLVFLPSRELAYWKGKTPAVPPYEDYYPGPEAAPVLGLSISAEEALPDGEVQRVLKDYRTRMARLGAKDSPLILLGSAECRETEKLECLRPVGDFDGTAGWWGPWGNLTAEVRPDPAPGACVDADPGVGHLALTTSDPEGKADWYAGGFTIPVPEDARDWTVAGALVFWAAAEKGARLGLQVDLCDGSTTRCPPSEPCCKDELWTALLNIEGEAFAPYALPFDAFKPPAGVDSGPLNLAGVRAVNLHVFRVAPGDGTILMDALALARLANDNRCSAARHSLVSQFLSPTLCSATPRILAVVLNWSVERSPGTVVDRRVTDRFFLKNLLDAACFSAVW